MFEEKTILANVELLVAANCIQVKWLNQILKDGVVISEVPHRKAYMQDQKAEFIAEVEGAQKYIDAMGW